MKPHEIKDLRLAKKLTQSELGEICGVDKASVSKWEKGKNNPSGGALKILQQLRSGEIVVTELSDLEAKLLEQNVKIGGFASAEDYLTASLKHLLAHGEFMNILPKKDTQAPRAPRKKANLMAAAGTETAVITCEVDEWNMEQGTVNVRIVGQSMEPMFSDDDIVTFRHKDWSRSPFMKKGVIYLVRYNDGYLIKRYNTRDPKPEEEGAEYLTNTGRVGVLESLNQSFPDIDITGPFEWEGWYDENFN
jgi:transcriptional regulator with XRE-family HTH domain